jgi:hypothetical protein
MSLHNQTLQWEGFPANNADGWNGFALLIDDVERFVGNALNFSLAMLDASVPHFFRLAVSFHGTHFVKVDLSRTFTSFQFQQDGTSGDFTQAATIWPNGTWVDPQPGPS